VSATNSDGDRRSFLSLLRGGPLPEFNKTEFMLPTGVLGFTYSGVILRRRLLQRRSKVLLEDQIVAGPMMKFLCLCKPEISITVFTVDSFM
jgi:hypothetical protein